MRVVSLACVVLTVIGWPLVSVALAQSPAPQQMFRIETDEFWLNLHHFLYVLGRAQTNAGDAKREAVIDAPAESERGLKKLTPDEQHTWKAAIDAYASGSSRQDAVRDEPLATVTARLTDADDARTLADVAIDASVRETLERAAPVYRKGWWDDHRASNRAWRASIETLVAQHGRTVLDFVTKAYGLPWPGPGFAVHAARFSNWAGAYSSARGVLVIASGYRHNEGLRGLEGIFHEAMHQWDSDMYRILGGLAKPIGARVPADAPHALIWVTAGEAIRRLDPSYVPTAEALGIWSRSSSGSQQPISRLKAPLEETWLPYLSGRGTRDEALTAFLKRISGPPPGDAPVVTVATLAFHSSFWVNLHHETVEEQWGPFVAGEISRDQAIARTVAALTAR